MTLSVRWIRIAAAVVAAAAVVHLHLLWQPERQVELHTANLLKRTSDRDWPAVKDMMGEDFRDGWGQDREQAVNAARLLFSHFFALRIVATEPLDIGMAEDEATVRAKLGIFGSGTGVAEVVMEEVRATEEPFVFRWRQAGRWPWQWVLVGAGNRRLESYRPAF